MIFIGGPRHLQSVPWRYESQPGPLIPVDVHDPDEMEDRPIFRIPTRSLYGEHGGPTHYRATLWHIYRVETFTKFDGSPYTCLASNSLTRQEAHNLLGNGSSMLQPLEP